MSFITEFSIGGLAGRTKRYSKKLNRDLNVFFGFNGSGKTSLLKILHSAMSNETEILRDVPFVDAEVKIYSDDFKQIFTKTIKRDPTQTEAPREVEFSGETSSRPSLEMTIRQSFLAHTSKLVWTETPEEAGRKKVAWKHRYLPTLRLYTGASEELLGLFRSFDSPSMLLSEEQMDKYFAASLERLWSSYSASILAEVRKAQEEGLANILKSLVSPSRNATTIEQAVNSEIAYRRMSSFLTRQGSPNILGSLDDFVKLYDENISLRNVVTDIDEVEQRIEEATAPRDSLKNMIQHMFSGNKDIRFTDRGISVIGSDNANISLSSLSSGEKQILRIFIETLLVEQNSLIIDEPELSLHIDWQRRLINSMQLLNNQAQYIMATHSPEIMADVDDRNIFRL